MIKNDLDCLFQKVAKLYKERKYQEAILFTEKANQIAEESHPHDYPKIRLGLDNLAILYQHVGRYSEAESLFQRALDIAEESVPPNPSDIAVTLNNLAAFYESIGKYKEAESLFQRALKIAEESVPPNPSDIGITLNNLAALYESIGNYKEAESLFQRSLEIAEESVPPNPSDIAVTLNNLATLYESIGKYKEAESLFQRALEIAEESVPPNPSDIAVTLNNLAAFYESIGKYKEAESLFQRALEIAEESVPPNPSDIAVTLNNLAILYESIGKYKEAESLLQRSLQIAEESVPPNPSEIAKTLNNLATLYESIGKYKEAESLFQRSLKIAKKTLPPDHPTIGITLNNLSILYESIGKYKEAESLFQRSLKIAKKALPPDHPTIGQILRNIAIINFSKKEHAKSHYYFKKGQLIFDKLREEVFQLLAERQKLSYICTDEIAIHLNINNILSYADSKIEDIVDIFNVWLRWKGCVAEYQGRYIDDIYHSDNPEIQRKFHELTTLSRKRVGLFLNKPEDLSFKEYKKRISKIEKEKERIEIELSALSKNFALEKRIGRADAESLRRRLPEDSLYLDYARIEIYDQKLQLKQTKYLCFLVNSKESHVKLIEVANAEEVEEQVAAYRQAIEEYIDCLKTYGSNSKADYNRTAMPNAPEPTSGRRAIKRLDKVTKMIEEAAKRLYGLLIKPLEQELKKKKQIFISPDGGLNLIPFEVLIADNGRYLIQDYIINYISAGRDIMRFDDECSCNPKAVIIADPDYDLDKENSDKTQIKNRQNIGIEGTGITKDVCKVGLFSRLPDTKYEADTIAKLLANKFETEVLNYQDWEASEEKLFLVEQPRILHISTHGFFLGDQKTATETQALQHVLRGGLMPAPDPDRENPMLRSGLALAGANDSIRKNTDYGIVSAEKILGLKLRGTELVTLSACGTGLGAIKSGEGVFGLKRAFILSGARSLVMSLWSVPSLETAELMLDFYSLFIKSGMTKAAALRQAKLNMMAKKPNPFYWAAFVLTGNPK